MSMAPTYSSSDLMLFTHVLDQIALEAGGLDEMARSRIGLRIAMGAAAGLTSAADLIAYARQGI